MLKFGKVVPSGSYLFVCDIQEIFRERIFQMPTVIQSTKTMMSIAEVLDIPIVVSTQYAKRFGPTVSELGLNQPSKNTVLFDKTKFSMWTKELEDLAINQESNKERKSVILCGIESHVCIQQTCIDLLENGFEVHLVADAVSSQTPLDRSVALQRMQQSGAFITTMESMAFQLLQDSKNPKFKECSQIIKDHGAFTNGFNVSMQGSSSL